MEDQRSTQDTIAKVLKDRRMEKVGAFTRMLGDLQKEEAAIKKRIEDASRGLYGADEEGHAIWKHAQEKGLISR
ncbi:hypothetical protein GCM10008018_60390 [Paenibacillus marchantiophytorum]|uniref:CopG family transcriptional regulator n=1 Tax=Paenibacillus marchantiophytorum TaxID=1619310 RepID=A0ABQ1FDX0_9BACL|nr:hypothetical protein [Paenibacillus marchantiophytorum]GGA06448.1 hypothetical protein GCM10008018_60390 [Paenibacillus marchantiophytorum]